ncbi:acyl-CoA N-acyltransferase [Cercophora scortea]|uniref:Acyl-CoA N-acyltransferase n=1 Tax=Cercophora scortea TaxID=314031 RepID=A0AAE0MI24_9PEZI|nr:acyl-CoA N-acyltransferase [Cercophora scortea]
MDDITHKLSTAFRSKRLLFRAVDSGNPADLALITSALFDPISQGLTDLVRLQPIPQSTGMKMMAHAAESALLAVFICLAPDDSELESDSPGARFKEAEAKATPIGSLALTQHPLPKTEHLRYARLALGISEPFQGKGFGKEAVNWALDWAFDYAGLNRVELGVASFNVRAVELYGKLGFTCEGRRRETVFVAGRWYDEVEFGMLQREWKGLRGRA